MVRVHGHGASKEQRREERGPMTRKNRNKPLPEMCQLCQLDMRLETLLHPLPELVENEQTLDSD